MNSFSGRLPPRQPPAPLARLAEGASDAASSAISSSLRSGGRSGSGDHTSLSYTSVSMISLTSKSRSLTWLTFILSSLLPSDVTVMPLAVSRTMRRAASRSTATNSASNSWSVHHAPPVMSRCGSRSNSMNTLRFLLCTLFTALITCRPSRFFRILVTVGCCRLVRALRSRIQMPMLPESRMYWSTSNSTEPRFVFLKKSSEPFL
mmetsp:Transcript_12639/g.39228  ORF Transcript_12639/g.39228 Transcript_12639/m.39228 type:complete len:205 (-) Transcript_12639:747-1361(-)